MYIDRRSDDRLPNPSCRRCDSERAVLGVVRTEFVIYFRCGSCGDVWSRPKPHPMRLPNTRSS